MFVIVRHEMCETQELCETHAMQVITIKNNPNSQISWIKVLPILIQN